MGLALGVVVLASASASAQLANGGFETAGSGGQVFSDWANYGFDGGNILRADASEVAPFEGSFSCKMFGLFNFAPQQDVVLQQSNIPAAAGEEWTLSVRNLHNSADPIQGPNFLVVVIDFYDAGNVRIGGNSKITIDANSPTDQWIADSVVSTAPTGTASVQATLVYIAFSDDPFNPGYAGAVFVDDVKLEKAGGTCAGDFDQNGVLNSSDFLAFLNAYVQCGG
jgi:hypothetical protein